MVSLCISLFFLGRNLNFFFVLFMKGAKFDSPFAFVHIISLCVLCLGSYFVFFALNLDSLLFLGLHLMFWCLALVVSQKQTKRNIRNRKLGIALFSSLCCERSWNCIEV